MLTYRARVQHLHARTIDTDRPRDRPITDTVIGDAFEGHHLEPVSDFVLTPSQALVMQSSRDNAPTKKEESLIEIARIATSD